MLIKKRLSKKTKVDTASRVVYSIVAGAIIDYFASGLRGWEIVGSRTTATGINSLTSKAYGRWQDLWYKILQTIPEKRKINVIFDSKDITEYLHKEKLKEITYYGGRRSKQYLTDLLAFNTFEPFVYGISNCAGQLIGQLFKHHFDLHALDLYAIDLQATYEGMKTVVYISPFIAPTMRWTMQGARKLFGIKTSAELAQDTLEHKVSDRESI